MKTKLLLASVLALSVQQTVLAQTDALGYTQANMTMGPSYQNRVFFNLADGNMVSQPANTWDVAFYRNSNFAFGSRVNDAMNIEVYTASTTLSDWDNINISNIASWGEPLYNPDQTTDISQGAFEQGPVTSPKFAIEDAFGGYTFKYSKWNGTAWGPTETRTIANGSDDAYFNYFSFTTGAKVPNMEPSKSAWDFMFTKYYTFYNNMMMYPLTGAIQGPSVKVAKVQPETQETAADANFSSNITTIGHS
jgi:hypothetical protein